MTYNLTVSAIEPLQLNPRSGEPYLRLPEPHSNIIITPPRLNRDAADMLSILNDPRVYLQLSAVPHPYEAEHGRSFLQRMKAVSDQALRDLVEAEKNCSRYRSEHPETSIKPEQKLGPTGLPLVKSCAVNVLREVKEDGTDIFIGDISARIYDFFHLEDENEAARLTAESEQREAGSPEIVWSIGDYLDPKYHGRGIMTAAIRTLIDTWMVPRMGARHIIVNADKENIGSVRVFEKNGFRTIGITDNIKQMPESKGGRKYGLHVLEWRTESA